MAGVTDRQAAPYDRAVDPNTARALLRLPPDHPVTLDEIDAAYLAATWDRHPSRYPEGEERREAEAWARTLSAARESLINAGTPATPPAPTPGDPRARRRPWVVVGIVAGSIAGLGAVLAAGLFLASAAVSAASTAAERQEAQSEIATDRYDADYTAYSFPAGLEVYSDGRLWQDCPPDEVRGCWQMAVLPEADCARLVVTVGYTDEYTATVPDAVERLTFDDAKSGSPTYVTFADDDYRFGWIQDVECVAPGS
ncbi:hypothetical protein ABIQ69_05975 [Agromyces sp. G08B096]|uniref:J domain-containing protein n=1 Tax=Agromyces sp. G08B096 TaxID=3156399 RepID=A0AAU7WCK8_9MICO